MYPFGVYGGRTCVDAELPVVIPEDTGLRPSPESALGGVKRLPTLVRLVGTDVVGRGALAPLLYG